MAITAWVRRRRAAWLRPLRTLGPAVTGLAVALLVGLAGEACSRRGHWSDVEESLSAQAEMIGDGADVRSVRERVNHTGMLATRSLERMGVFVGLGGLMALATMLTLGWAASVTRSRRKGTLSKAKSVDGPP